MASFTIPNDYTACETYRGCIIALRNGRYSVFEQSAISPQAGARWPETYNTRAEARGSIDFAIKHERFVESR